MILVYDTLHYTRDFLPWKTIGGETMNSCFDSNKNMMLGNVNVFKEHTVHSRKPCAYRTMADVKKICSRGNNKVVICDSLIFGPFFFFCFSEVFA